MRANNEGRKMKPPGENSGGFLYASGYFYPAFRDEIFSVFRL